jgi:hypothetical protein
MKKAIEHKVQAQIKSEAPEILFEIIYQDDFTNDHYVLKGSGLSDKGSKLMEFNVSKNGKELPSLKMEERNVEEFINNFLATTKDDDFNTEFKSKIYEQSTKEIKDFFEFFDNSIVLKGLTLEGELKRMKKMAGIIKS